MTLPFEDSLRRELMAATKRSPRRRAPNIAAGATAVALVAILATTWVGSDPTAADVEITRADGRVTVRLADLENTPEDVEDATDEGGLDVDVEGVPAGPSHIGRFVGDFYTDAETLDVEKLDSNGVTYLAFSLPEDWTGSLTVYLGRPANESESYRIASDAFAPGEPLACTGTLGGPLEDVADLVDDLHVTVQAFDAQQQPSAPVSYEAALETGLRTEAITGATATSAKTLLIDVGRDVPPREYPPVLTTHVEEVDVDTRRVRIDVASMVVRLALSYVSEESGWYVCSGADHACRCLRIADRHLSTAPVDILVVRDSPSECQDALRAVLAGNARAVVLWDEPTTLINAVDALGQRAAVIPERVIELAQQAPHLSDRQRHTLRLVAAGRSNTEISSALHQSTSTTNRDIGDLLTIFDAANRASLTRAATRLGFLTA